MAKTLKYLLVCEGPTDIQVIDKIAKKISIDTGNNIEIRELSPQRDQTTKRYPNHGWEEVRKWCKIYGKSDFTNENPFALLAQKKSWQSLVKISGAEGLIIQMDTDIAKYINDLLPPFRNGSRKKARKNYCRKAILNWLGEASIPNESYFLLSTYATETWLLSTHERDESFFTDLPNDFDFEDIENVIDRLISIGYISYTDTEGKVKLNKNLNTYENYSKNIADNLQKVRSECEEVENLCSFLES